jgi:amidase
VSFKPPAQSFAHLDDGHRQAVERAAELVRSFGHTVIETQVDYGRVMANSTLRYLAGVHDDAASMPRPQLLARTTRRAARLGGLVPASALRRARRAESTVAARMNRSFLEHDVDVVLTPLAAAPPRLADVADLGLLRSLLRSNVASWAVPWNVIGQPAASVFVGFDAAGLPMAAQLCGRRDDESTIIRLAHQIASVHHWT